MSSCAVLYKEFINSTRYDRFELKIANSMTLGDDGAVVRTGDTHWICNASNKSEAYEPSTRKWTHISAVSLSDVYATKYRISQTVLSQGNFNFNYAIQDVYYPFKILTSNDIVVMKNPN